MKRLLTGIVSAALVALVSSASAQKVSEVSVKMGKEQHPGFLAQSRYGKKEVSVVLVKKLETAGLGKGSSKKGFRVFRGVVWQELSSNKLDVYYRVKGNRKKSKVYFMASKGYDNFINAANDAVIAGNVTNVLQSLDKDAAVNREIKEKQGKLKKLEERNEQSAKQAEQLKNDIGTLQAK